MRLLSEPFIFKLISFVRRVACKFNCRLCIVQKVLASALPAKVDVPDEPLHISNCGTDKDLKPLRDMLPDGHYYGTTLCGNDLSHKDDFDLEIIIPVYNVEEYVDKCLESVIGQKTNYNFLVVVVNDGSTDGSRDLLVKYGKYPNVEIIDQKNAGLSSARNAGLKHLRGRYVTFVDSDDWLLPGAVESLMNAAVKYDADLVEGGFKILYGQKLTPGNSHELTVSDRWMGRLQGYAWGKVVRSELFAKSCFPVGYLFEDTLMSLTIYPQCHRIVTITDNVYVYRANPNGITATTSHSPRAVEGVLVTIQVLEDNLSRGIRPDMQEYDNFLRSEVSNTFFLTYMLRNREVSRHVFSVYCRLLKQYFPGFETSNSQLMPLERALRTKDYRGYVAAILAEVAP